MSAIHRNGDARSCGAATVVSGQSTTFVDSKLWAVAGDKNSHGNGALIPSGTTVFVEGKLIIVHSPDSAMPDDLCQLSGGEHCTPRTAQGSSSAFCYG